jgi:hypothetical protein
LISIESRRVSSAACGADLTLEAVRAECGGQLGMEDLQRDRAVVLEVVSEVDGGHPTASELALDDVAICQSGFERVSRIGHPEVLRGVPYYASTFSVTHQGDV